VSRTRRQAPAHKRPKSPIGFGTVKRRSRMSRAIRVSPRTCKPIMMMAMPAMMDNCADQAREGIHDRSADAERNEHGGKAEHEREY
jgi:hypothetical protein